MTTPPDAPDWTNAQASLPVFLGSLTMPGGSRIVSETFQQVPLATGILVLVPGIPVGVGIDKVQCQVVGNDTGNLYFDRWSDNNVGMQVVCGAALNLESSFKVEVVYPGPPGSPTIAAYVWALFGPNVSAPFTAREQPTWTSPTRGQNCHNTRGQIFSASTGTSGDQNLGTIGINSNGARYLRRMDLLASWGTTAGTSAWSVYLKGVTSATTQTLYTGAALTGVAGTIAPPLNYDNHPLDLVDMFPSDVSLQVHVVNLSAMVVAVNAIVTP